MKTSTRTKSKNKKREKAAALKAMKKLRGSGNGKLMKRLLKERQAERAYGNLLQ